MSEIINDSTNKRQRLGRGLGSLLGAGVSLEESRPEVKIAPTQMPKEATNVPMENRIWVVEIEKIVTSEFQPRSQFTKESLQELAESIKTNGIIQPILVRRTNDNKFEIVAGERRWRAAQLAGKKEVPVIVKTLSNQETLEMAIIENIQREDLNPVEEAKAYHKLAQSFSLTQQQIAEKVGKERATVANSLRLLSLPEEVLEMVQDKRLSPGHAKCLLGLDQAEMVIQLARMAIAKSLSVRKLESEIKKETAEKNAQTSTESSTLNRNHIAQKVAGKLAEELQKELGTKVTIDYQNSKGKISIHFYSDDELTQLADRIRK